MKNHYVIRTEQDKQDFSLSFSKFKLKEPITINIDLFYKKNSNQQLRAYWRLIKVCKSFMNNQGNNFNDTDVSDYFKIYSGHYKEADGVKLPRSIALDSGTNNKEKKQHLDTIL